MQPPRSFASDNNSGIHPKILEALVRVNQGQYISYGADPFSERVLEKFKEHFGDQSEAHLVFNGTAANVLGLKAITQSYNSVLCSDVAHAQIDECGAPENYLGCKLVLIPSHSGKLQVEDLQKFITGVGDQHHVQPKVVSLTQSTEMGTVYTLLELRQISQFCRDNALYLHMDGARLSNAAAALGVSLRETTTDVGVDVLSFGGTKNGLLAGEAVVFLNPELGHDFKFIRKQGMQLPSKMRYLAVQFEALLTDNLWLKNAKSANLMTQKLYLELQKIGEVKILETPQVNAVFAILPLKAITFLQKEFFFYVIDPKIGLVRWMTSYETTEEDVSHFISALRRALTQ